MLYTEEVVRCYTQITSSICLARCLKHIFARLLQDVFKTSSTSWKTKNCYAGDVLKTSLRHVLNMSAKHLGDKQEISVSCNRYLNLYLTVHLRWIQNALILILSNFDICLIFKFKQHIYFKNQNFAGDCSVLRNQLNSCTTLQNRWSNKNKVLSNILNKYSHLHLHLKNIFTLKKPPHLLTYWWRNQVLICYRKNMTKTPKEKKFTKRTCIFT